MNAGRDIHQILFLFAPTVCAELLIGPVKKNQNVFRTDLPEGRRFRLADKALPAFVRPTPGAPSNGWGRRGFWET